MTKKQRQVLEAEAQRIESMIEDGPVGRTLWDYAEFAAETLMEAGISLGDSHRSAIRLVALAVRRFAEGMEGSERGKNRVKSGCWVDGVDPLGFKHLFEAAVRGLAGINAPALPKTPEGAIRRSCGHRLVARR